VTAPDATGLGTLGPTIKSTPSSTLTRDDPTRLLFTMFTGTHGHSGSRRRGRTRKREGGKALLVARAFDATTRCRRIEHRRPGTVETRSGMLALRPESYLHRCLRKRKSFPASPVATIGRGPLPDSIPPRHSCGNVRLAMAVTPAVLPPSLLCLPAQPRRTRRPRARPALTLRSTPYDSTLWAEIRAPGIVIVKQGRTAVRMSMDRV